MFCKRWCECRPKTSGTLAFLLVTSSSVNPSDCRAFSSIFSSNSVRWPFSPRVPVALTAYFRRRERGAVRDATYKQVNAQAAVIFRTRTEQEQNRTVITHSRMRVLLCLLQTWFETLHSLSFFCRTCDFAFFAVLSLSWILCSDE